MRFQQRVAIVTGAGSGMGRATAKKLVSEGAKVALVDINGPAVEETQSLLQQYKNETITVVGDISKVEFVKNIIDQTVQAFRQIDIVANIAGIPMPKTAIEEVDEDFWDKQFLINARAPFLLSKYAMPYLKKVQGNIINVASIASVRPRPGLSAYCASKGALVEFTRSLAIEVAKDKVRVNIVNPGPADTPMLKEFYSTMDPIEGRKVYEDSVPLGRLCQPEDIAKMVAYLASDDASFITGAIMNVDGGRGL